MWHRSPFDVLLDEAQARAEEKIRLLVRLEKEEKDGPPWEVAMKAIDKEWLGSKRPLFLREEATPPYAFQGEAPDGEEAEKRATKRRRETPYAATGTVERPDDDEEEEEKEAEADKAKGKEALQESITREVERIRRPETASLDSLRRDLANHGPKLTRYLAARCLLFVEEFNEFDSDHLNRLPEEVAVCWGLVALQPDSRLFKKCLRSVVSLRAASARDFGQWRKLEYGSQRAPGTEDQVPTHRLVDEALVDTAAPLTKLVRACRIYAPCSRPARGYRWWRGGGIVELSPHHLVAIHRARSKLGSAFLGDELSVLVERVLLAICCTKSPPIDNGEWLDACALILANSSSEGGGKETLDSEQQQLHPEARVIKRPRNLMALAGYVSRSPRVCGDILPFVRRVLLKERVACGGAVLKQLEQGRILPSALKRDVRIMIDVAAQQSGDDADIPDAAFVSAALLLLASRLVDRWPSTILVSPQDTINFKLDTWTFIIDGSSQFAVVDSTRKPVYTSVDLPNAFEEYLKLLASDVEHDLEYFYVCALLKEVLATLPYVE